MKLVPSKLAKELHLIQLLSTRNVLRKHLFAIRDEANTFFSSSSNEPFVAFCFGRYDVAIDIIGTSGDSLIQKSHDFELHINSMFGSELEGRSAVSSSHLFYTQILDEKKECSPEARSSVRAYCFLRHPIKRVCMQEGRADSYVLEEGCGLFWNPSLYSLLFIANASSFHEVASKVFSFLDIFSEQLKRSSTLVTVNLDECYHEETHKDISALTFIKMKKFEKIGNWSRNEKSTASTFGRTVDTFGWYDRCVFQETKTLWELMSNVLDLREKHPSIDYTSTTILGSEENEV